MLEINKIYCMDVIEFLKQIDDDSVDAVITDPPYGLEFMGKDWDKFKRTGKSRLLHGTEEGVQGVYGKEKNFKVLPRFPKDINKGLQEFTYKWAKECLRVMKHGAYLLTFGGTRTHHRLTCGLEDAGFIIKDELCWGYASGFPKSYDISKGFDKKAGVEREVIGKGISGKKESHNVFNMAFEEGKKTSLMGGEFDITIPKTELAKKWQGWGTALKPAFEPIILAQKPIEKSYVDNVEKYQVGGLNIDECRIEFENTQNPATNPKYRLEAGYKIPARGQESEGVISFTSSKNITNIQGRFPANLILTNEIFDKDVNGVIIGGMGISGTTSQGGILKKNPSSYLGTNTFKIGYREKEYPREIDDVQGDYNRFFLIPKASSSEKNENLDDLNNFSEVKYYTKNRRCKICGHQQISGSPCKCKNPEWVIIEREMIKNKNIHPTVKPLRLIKWLIKLIVPYKQNPNAIVIDPFVGSGTTAIACKEMGINFICNDKEKDYIEIANKRLSDVQIPLTKFEGKND